MPLGAFAPLPIRLGGSSEQGWNARMHARVCADMVASKRAAPVAVFVFTKVGAVITVTTFLGQNGAGLAHAPDTIVSNGTGDASFEWSDRAFEDPYEISHPLAIRGGRATGSGTAAIKATVTTYANGARVRLFDATGTATDGTATVRLF